MRRANLRALYRLPTVLVTAYWRRVLNGPRGELWFGAHSRAAPEEETVPVERVKLGTQTITEQQQIKETVRKEQIETEGAEGSPPRQQ